MNDRILSIAFWKGLAAEFDIESRIIEGADGRPDIRFTESALTGLREAALARGMQDVAAVLTCAIRFYEDAP
ncbi:hypothetical protein [Streptomyces sp. NPDC055085]